MTYTLELNTREIARLISICDTALTTEINSLDKLRDFSYVASDHKAKAINMVEKRIAEINSIKEKIKLLP